MSAAGFRPGFGRGGTIHSFLVKIDEVCSELNAGMRGLLIMEDVAGARGCGGATRETGDGVFEKDIMDIMVIRF